MRLLYNHYCRQRYTFIRKRKNNSDNYFKNTYTPPYFPFRIPKNRAENPINACGKIG